MKKLIFITLAISLLLTATSFGSQTRVLTMGDNNTILVDDANIWQFPSRINDYPGLAIAELGYAGFTNVNQFGVHWQFGADNPWVLATYFDNKSPFQTDDLMGGFLVPVPFDFNLLENRRINVFWGTMFGNNFFGARASLNQSGREFSDSGPPPTSFKESFGYYQLSLSLTDANKTWDLGVDIGIGSWTDEDDGQTETDADGYYDFRAHGRMFWNSGPNYSYVPHAMLMVSKRGINDYAGLTSPQFTTTFTGLMVEVGIGQVYTPANNVEAVLDIGLAYSKVKHEFEDLNTATNNFERNDKTTTIPFFKLGLDAEVFRWMDVRLGATSDWDRFTDDQSTNTSTIEFKNNNSNNETYLGFGFHWGNLHVDTYTDPQLFLNGFDFISGNGSGDMNFQISAIYEML